VLCHGFTIPLSDLATHTEPVIDICYFQENGRVVQSWRKLLTHLRFICEIDYDVHGKVVFLSVFQSI